MTKNIAKTEEKALSKGELLKNTLLRMAPDIKMALPKHVTAERMVRVAITAIAMTPELANCSQASFMTCLLTAAQLGLEPNTPLGHAYLIPREMSVKRGQGWGKELRCTLQLGYQGLLDLAYRSGMVVGVQCDVVYPGDVWQFERGLNPVLVHRWGDDPNRGLDERQLTHAWAVVDVTGHTRPLVEVMTKAEVEKRRLVNRAEKGPWKDWYAEMAKKTVLRAALKRAPKSAENARAMLTDYEGASEDGRLGAVIDERLADALSKHQVLDLGEGAGEDERALEAGSGARAAAARMAAEAHREHALEVAPSAPRSPQGSPAAKADEEAQKLARSAGARRRMKDVAVDEAEAADEGLAAQAAIDQEEAAARALGDDDLPQLDAADEGMPAPPEPPSPAELQRRATGVGGWKWVKIVQRIAECEELKAIELLEAGYEVDQMAGKLIPPKGAR